MAAPKKKSSPVRFSLLTFLLEALLALVFAAGLGVFALYRHLEPQLPDTHMLKEMHYQMPMSVYTRDGRLIGQFGEKKRMPVAYAAIPEPFLNAFLAAEDDRFFEHPGVDYQGILRAVFSFALTGEKRQGGSTITMQVARNFFLSSEKTMLRKVREIMLAIRIEQELSKQQIFELYLNKIYFGHHAYGIEAAAQVYFGKSIQALSLSEMAVIAGLPKAPSAYNPVANPERARIRRNYVLRRMRKLDMISDEAFQDALNTPLVASIHTTPYDLNAPYVAEMVRSEVFQQYGEESYDLGYKVYATIDSRLQTAAQNAVLQGLRDYDERHGYRGAVGHVDLRLENTPEAWNAKLLAMGQTSTLGRPALVTAVKDRTATLYTGQPQSLELGPESVRWTHRSLREVLKAGDLIRIRPAGEQKWQLTQIPAAESALVALNAQDGSIAALVGGSDFLASNFNRVTQAQRQPGSGFKPILYAAALEHGFTPASIVNDAPMAFADPASPGGVWRPHNYTERFYGPTRLREALAKSRNMVSIRLLKDVGIDDVIDQAMLFGFSKNELPHSLTLALGSGIATPLQMASAYAVFANGGFHVDPYLIDRIETQDGRVLYAASPARACPDCASGSSGDGVARRIISPETHYMMNSMLQDVIRQGTATQALQLGRQDLAGKTGTTNDYRDAWFSGYAPGFVATAWVGKDSYTSLGEKETGGHTALPMWMYFMKEAMAGQAERSFKLPSGLHAVHIDPGNGQVLGSAVPGSLLEYLPEHEDSVNGSEDGSSYEITQDQDGTQLQTEPEDEVMDSGSSPATPVMPAPTAPPARSSEPSAMESLF